MEFRPVTADEVREAQAAGKLRPPAQLALSMVSCITSNELHENFYATLERGFEPINEYLGKFSGSCSIVGAGPTIKQTHKELKGDVIAINSAIGYLLDQGIVPKFALLWDGTEIVYKFCRRHPDITYLVASRCHPRVFEELKGCKVIVWHAAGDHDIAEVMQKPEVIAKMPIPQPLICGGSAGITRTIYVASCLGYTDLHIYGADSCYSAEGATHINGSVVPEKDVWISLGDGTPGAPMLIYRTTPEWCQQINEYRGIYTLTITRRLASLTEGPENVVPMEIEVHGESLFKAMHDRLVFKRKELGDEKFVQHIQFQLENQAKLDEAASAEIPNFQPLGEEAHANARV